MKTLSHHATLTLVAISLLAVATQATAEVRVDVFSTIEFPFLDQTLINPTSAEIGPITSSASLDTGEVHAQAALNTGSLLKTRASAIINGSNVRTTLANASWQDVLLASGSTPPSSVRFNFTIHGQFTITRVTGGSLSSPKVSLAVANITTRNFLGFTPFGINSGTKTSSVSPDDLMVRIESIDQGSFGSSFDAQAFAGSSQAWLTESLVETSPGIFDFIGSFAITSPFTSAAAIGFGATSDGYPLSLGITTLAGGSDSISATDFFNTIQLASITQTDGSPLPSTLNLIFESGLTIPEPATLTLLALACPLLIRRRQPR